MTTSLIITFSFLCHIFGWLVKTTQPWPRLLTFNVDDKFFGLDLETLFGAGSNFANPSPSIAKIQVGHTDGTVIVWIFSKPLDAAALDVDAFANDISVEVWSLPAAQMNLSVCRTMQNDIVANFLT